MRVHQRHHRREARVRAPEHAHLAVGLGHVLHQPVDRVVGIRGVVDLAVVQRTAQRPGHHVVALRAVLSAHVLVDADVAVGDEHLVGHGQRRDDAGRLDAGRGAGGVVGRPRQHHRRGRGPLRNDDDGVELHAVAHRDHLDALHVVGWLGRRLEGGRDVRRERGCLREREGASARPEHRGGQGARGGLDLHREILATGFAYSAFSPDRRSRAGSSFPAIRPHRPPLSVDNPSPESLACDGTRPRSATRLVTSASCIQAVTPRRSASAVTRRGSHEDRRVHGAVRQEAFRGNARLRRQPRLDRRRDRHRRLPGRRLLQAGPTAGQREEAEGVPRGHREARADHQRASAATATRCTRRHRSARRTTRSSNRRCSWPRSSASSR